MKNSISQNENDRRPRWMLVDDNPDILSLIRDIAARFSDVDIECFDSPQAALAAFEAEPEAFEFVITDLELPDVNGFEWSRRLRGFHPSLKILLSTGSEIISDEEAAQKGFCGFWRRPFPFAAMQQALQPATLKYSINFSGLNDRLRLVRAN
jgi:CheY-like chemotaxis protein